MAGLVTKVTDRRPFVLLQVFRTKGVNRHHQGNL